MRIASEVSQPGRTIQQPALFDFSKQRRDLTLVATTGSLGAAAEIASMLRAAMFDVVNVAANDVLNIRAEPSARAKKLGSIPPDGTCIHNLGCTGGLAPEAVARLTPAEQAQQQSRNRRWCKVRYDGVTGWTAGRYLRAGTCNH